VLAAGAAVGVSLALPAAARADVTIEPLGPWYELADQYVAGTQEYELSICVGEGDANIQRLALEEVDVGLVFEHFINPSPARASQRGAATCGWYTGDGLVDSTEFAEGAHTFRALAWGADEYASGAWVVYVDRTAPSAVAGIYAAADGGDAVIVHWRQASDPPLADTSPGSGLGGYSVRYRINSGTWSAWQPRPDPWVAVPGADGDDQIDVEARSLDAVGNVSVVSTATVIAAAGVVRAQVFVDEPSQTVTFAAVESFIPTTGLSRYEESDSIATRDMVGCGTPAAICAEYRQRSRRSETNPSASDTFVRYRGTTPFDDRIPFAGDADDLRSVAVENTPDDTGTTSNVKFSWQTLPPGAGTTYELFDSEIGEDEIAGTAVDGTTNETDTPASHNVRTRLVADSATKLPLRLTKFDTDTGTLLARMVWSYDANVTPRSSLPADYFSAAVPANLRLDKQIEYSDEPPSQALARSLQLDTSQRLSTGRLCFGYSQNWTYFEAATNKWAAQMAPWLNARLTRESTFYRLRGPDGTCPESGAPDLAVESTPAAGKLALAWQDEYTTFGAAVSVPGPSLKAPGVRPVRLDGVAKDRGYLLDLGAGKRGAYFEQGVNAVMVRGRFVPTDLQTIVTALEG
jgi:hypothetical protein